MNSVIHLNGGSIMPLVGLGTWDMRHEEAYRSVLQALEVGYRQIDTATGYGNEDEIGRALHDSGIPREEVFVTTKLPAENEGRERRTLQESLRDLRTDYVDLWLVHWPPRGESCPRTWAEFIAIRDLGLAREIGVSNYTTMQIDGLIHDSGVAPALNQIPGALALRPGSTEGASRSRGRGRRL